MQLSFRGTGGETVQSFLERLEYRVRYYRFFFLAPLYLALPGFLWAMRERRFLWVGLTLAAFAMGSNFYPNFEPHYIRRRHLPLCSRLCCRVATMGALQPRRRATDRVRLRSRFIFWYSMHLFDTQEFSMAVRQYETWDGLNHRNPAGGLP